jgi:hypothetical protein
MEPHGVALSKELFAARANDCNRRPAMYDYSCMTIDERTGWARIVDVDMLPL